LVAFEQYIRAQMAERRKVPGMPGLMSEVLRQVDSGNFSMSDDELVASFTIEMVLGGHEATAGMLVSSLYHLLADQSRWARLVAAPNLIDNGVEECLRYEPPTLGLFRTTTRAVEIAGTEIPAGARIFWLNTSANHDPRQFEDPDAFRLERKDARTHLTFGSGRHSCIGSPLARLELRVAYQEMVKHLPSLRLARDETGGAFHSSLRLRIRRELNVEWDAA
jgi:cytochrome P450